ncbi:hypothetical protein [Mucilaginibacter myungsuensis]|uniref:Lipoprotein n=1 Tax=Mucilaginibacter myungsuensis TaxID=649104 RepID=A0A929L261_9SPHI|nr:hypothetical protein [Mucilaginibacter myungsuensis]MBE9662715.1 hypothetical protein [Mucilaginibacter myungsuensis]MDN3598135.1 hypothetical protein [Mucilaginibacter myungsuensis]
MKKLSLISFALILFISACKKDKAVITAELSNEEAIEIASSALASSNDGFASVATDLSLNAQLVYDLKLACGATKTFSATHKNNANAAVTYNFTYGYNYTVNCNTNNLIDNVSGSATATGSFDGPKLSATHTGNATFRVTGLAPTSLIYILDANYTRSGKFTSKTGNRASGTTAVDLAVSNYSVNKVTKAITSGTGTLKITGTTDAGATFTFNAAITFTNDGNATVTINGSATYIVNLTTGTVTKK